MRALKLTCAALLLAILTLPALESRQAQAQGVPANCGAGSPCRVTTLTTTGAVTVGGAVTAASVSPPSSLSGSVGTASLRWGNVFTPNVSDGNSIARLQIANSSSNIYLGAVADGASAVEHSFRSNATISTSGSKIAQFCTDSACATERFAVFANGKLLTNTGGSAAVEGTSSAMVAGVVTITTSAVGAGSQIHLTHAGSNITNLGILYVGTVTAGTSFQIKSANASDTDTVHWWLQN
jgi:hypothetical protein